MERRQLWARREGRRGGWSLALLCAAGAVAVLAVPYAVPVRPALSVSYCMGFSNRAAVAGLLVFVAVFGWWYGPWPALPDETEQRAARRGGRLLAAVLLTAAATGVMWWYSARFGPVYEALYFLDRLQHLQAGERIYRDFEFAYGAGLLYAPLLLSRVLHVRLLHGYFLALLLEAAAGVVLAWWTVQGVAGKSDRAGRIFLLLVLAALPWLLLSGAQYTVLRFWSYGAVLVLLERLLRRGRVLPFLAAMAAGMVWALLVSPEEGVVIVAGLGLGTVCFLRPGTRRWWMAWAGVGEGCVLLLVPAGTGVYTTMGAMARGAYAVPVPPAPALLPVVGALLVGGCLFVEAVRRRAELHGALLLLAGTVFAVPGALGRYDPVHLLGNLCPAVLVGLWMAGAHRGWRRWTVGTFLLFYLAWPYWLLTLQSIVLERRARAVGNVAKVEAERASVPALYAPFGSPDMQDSAMVVRLRGQSGRFFAMENVMTEEEVRELVAELERHDRVLVQAHSCVWGPSRKEVLLFTQGLFVRKAVREATLLQPVCTALDREYRVAERLGGGVVVMERRP